MKKLLLSLFFVSLTISINAQQHTNVAGTWKMTVETSAGSGSPTFILTHTNETTLTGKYNGQLGEADVTGTLQQKKIHLQFTVMGNLIEYDGEVEGEKMSGKVKLGTMGDGTFKGERKKN